MDAGNEDAVPQATSLQPEPLYEQALSLMQEGRWQEAGEVVAALEERKPGSPEARSARQMLSLHLSAEETWSSVVPRGPAFLRVPAIRALLIANLALYLLLAAVWLLTR